MTDCDWWISIAGDFWNWLDSYDEWRSDPDMAPLIESRMAEFEARWLPTKNKGGRR